LKYFSNPSFYPSVRIDKTPMDSVVTPMGNDDVIILDTSSSSSIENDDVIIVDTSYASSMMSLKNHQAIDKTPMENDDDVLYVGNEFWTFSTDDPILKDKYNINSSYKFFESTNYIVNKENDFHREINLDLDFNTEDKKYN
jgi:hypothetical protein